MPAHPRTASSLRESLADVVAVIALLGIVYACAVRILSGVQHPEEDAAMLLRYARHIAQGYGIVWNPGEKPVDGATDFLYMMAVAGATRAGFSLEMAARAVGFAAHLLAVLVVYVAVRRLYKAPPPIAWLPAAYLAAGPGLWYVAAGFGTTLFALTVAVAWWAAVRVADTADLASADAVRFGLACLVMGLARPEGVFLALFLLAAVLAVRRGADALVILKAVVITFGLLGLAYFLWRWSYFGHPLPNPFYRRGGGMLHRDVLARAVRNVLRLGAPFLAVIVVGVAWPRTRRSALLALGPTALFTLLWVLFSDEANYYMRYRYPVLPIVLMGWVPVAAGVVESCRERWRPIALAIGSVAVALGAAAGLRELWRSSPVEIGRIGLYDVAVRLAALRSGVHTLATTEAGLLPLYSDWVSVDTWGLNDAWIAQHGTVSDDYLDRYHPDVIMFHAYFTPEDREKSSGRGLGPAWGRMTATLESYARTRRYRLAAVYRKNVRESHFYYVRRGVLDEERILAALRIPDYEWEGRPAVDVTPAS